MDTWGIILLIVIIVIFLYLASCIIVTGVLNHQIFGVRGRDPLHPCYVHYEDYDDLERTRYQFLYKNKKINGFIYKEKNRNEFKDSFIILSHGLFGSHIQYIIDIHYLCKEGYIVLAYDQYGVGLSEGESQISLYQGIETLNALLDDVERRKINNDKEICLYGHSWGAYSILGVLGKHPEIKKAVLRSGPISPSQAGKRLIYILKRKYYYLIKPTLSFCMLLLVGKKSLTKANKNIKKNTKTKILVIQAKDDPMVLYKDSQAFYFNNHKQNNVEILLTEKGLHNSIITEESYQKFINKTKEYKQIYHMEDSIEKTQKLEEFTSSLSRVDMIEYDNVVKDKILDFLK